MLFTVGYIFIMHFVKQENEIVKRNYLIPFVWAFTSFTLIFTFVNFVNLIMMIVGFLKRVLKKKLKVEPKLMTKTEIFTNISSPTLTRFHIGSKPSG